MNPLDVGALAAVAFEWLALGWLSGIAWPHASWAPRWALRLLTGACFVSAAQLLIAFVGPAVGNIPLVLTLATVAAGTLRLASANWRRPPVEGRDTQGEGPGPERLGWFVLGAVLVAASLHSLLVPETGWDAFSHWGLRAQAFAITGAIVNAHSEHEYYPPLVPLLEAWLDAHRGGVSLNAAKTIWALVGSAFAICLAWHLRLTLPRPRRWLASWLASGIVLATPALLDGFATGQADLPLTSFLTLTALAVVQWQRSANRAWLVQAGVFAAAAALTKFEGLPRLGVLVAAVLLEAVLERRWRLVGPALLLLVAAALAALVWTAFELTHGIAPNGEHIGQLQLLALGSVLLALVAVFGGVRTAGGLLVAALSWIVAAPRLLCPPLRLPVLMVAGQLVATVVAFLLSSTAPEIEVRTSATRLFEQFVPLALFVSAIGLSHESSTYNRPGR